MPDGARGDNHTFVLLQMTGESFWAKVSFVLELHYLVFYQRSSLVWLAMGCFGAVIQIAAGLFTQDIVNHWSIDTKDGGGSRDISTIGFQVLQYDQPSCCRVKPS